jgi:hypothetical protein
MSVNFLEARGCGDGPSRFPTMSLAGVFRVRLGAPLSQLQSTGVGWMTLVLAAEPR